MSIGWLIILGIALVALFVGLFSMLTDPREVDAEEKESVDRQDKRRWWRRHK